MKIHLLRCLPSPLDSVISRILLIGVAHADYYLLVANLALLVLALSRRTKFSKSLSTGAASNRGRSFRHISQTRSDEAATEGEDNRTKSLPTGAASKRGRSFRHISQTRSDKAETEGEDDTDLRSSGHRLKFWTPRSQARKKVMERDEKSGKAHRWMSSFVHDDPRQQINHFFNDVAQDGCKSIHEKGVSGEVPSLLLKAFPKASAFSVWRPTSREAIRKLMAGEGTGKGLDVKGKSSKYGCLSANVPFMQIHEEEHKRKIRSLERGSTLKIFYDRDDEREEAIEALAVIAEEMHKAVVAAKAIMDHDLTDEEFREQAEVCLKWDMHRVSSSSSPIADESPYVRRIEDPQTGIEIPERLFWEAFVIRKDISRPPGSKYDTGRPSMPAFQDMNFATMRKESKPGDPRPVIFQLGPSLCPQSLVIAYEENNRVLPVVSDFDCFIVGTRNVEFNEPLPKDQIELLVWMVDNIETILAGPISEASWTTCWLEVLREATLGGYYPKIPKFGFGDPMSYVIMEHAVARMKQNGAVRHGAECFNYYFPQDIDEEFLFISDELPGKVPWKYVKQQELQNLLMKFIDKGFTFPINPKWVLCDAGWKPIYDKLLESKHPNVRNSVDIWYPPKLRKRIEDIGSRFPRGFQMIDSNGHKNISDETDAINMAKFELEHFINMNTKTMFEKIGGDATLTAAVDEFLYRMTTDPELAPFFKGLDAGMLKDHQRRFLKMAFTGIPTCVDIDKMILNKHARLFKNGLNEKHFVRAIGHLEAALEHVDVPKEMTKEACAIIDPLRFVFEQGATQCKKNGNKR